MTTEAGVHMSEVITPPGTAAEILARFGVEEDTSFYGRFTDEADKVMLTVPLRIMSAWAGNDPDTFADVFTENGSLLLQDKQLTSREEIRAFMTAGFAGPLRGAHVTGWPLLVTRLSEGVGMVVTQGGIVMPGDSELLPEREIRATWLIVAREGQWQLLSHQSCPARG